jgi:hypothetical protein
VADQTHEVPENAEAQKAHQLASRHGRGRGQLFLELGPLAIAEAGVKADFAALSALDEMLRVAQEGSCQRP